MFKLEDVKRFPKIFYRSDSMWEKELADMLEEEKKLLEKVLEKERVKRECLLNREVDKLLEINSEEERIFEEIEKCEFVRNSIVTKVARKLGIYSEEITLSKILEFASNRRTLEELRNGIVSLISEIRLLSLENKILLESSLNISLSVIERMMGVQTSSGTYNPRGNREIKVDLTTYSTVM